MVVRIHKNLHNGLWAITMGGKIAGYCTSCDLSNVTVKLTESIRDKNLNRVGKPPKRSVHLWVQGDISNVRGYQGKNLESFVAPERDLPATPNEVTYNPMKHKTMVYRDSGAPFECAHTASFTTDDRMTVS